MRQRPPAHGDARSTRRRWRLVQILADLAGVLIMLLIGLFPIIYTLMVSFQNINMMEEDTFFSGLMNYARLVGDARLWWALVHTLIFTAIA
ncbi:MAG: sugar ABC transporter permease, partial [Rhizobiales bacterium]|nr:sugar ABC transporter permease [Hyphomicrobiales bacterium]